VFPGTSQRSRVVVAAAASTFSEWEGRWSRPPEVIDHYTSGGASRIVVINHRVVAEHTSCDET
jgi:hypothetical protein